MNVEELERSLQALLDEVKPIAIKSRSEDLSDEESTRFDELTGKINEVGQQLATAKARRAKADEVLGTIDQFSQSRGRVSGIVPGAAPESRTSRSDPSLPRHRGRSFVESEEFKLYQRTLKGSSGRVEMGSAFFDGTDPLASAYSADTKEIDQRALVYTGGVTGLLQPQRIPGVVTGDPFPLRVRDVLQNGRTDSNTIEYVRNNGSTLNAAEVAEATSVGGATSKPESAINLEVVSTSVKTIAHWIPVTRQMLQDAAQIETFIESELLYGLRKREDAQLATGDGSGANLRGIANTTGIQVLDATYWGTNPLAADGNELDALRRAAKAIRVTGESLPSFVLAHPDDVEQWDTLKDGDGNYLLKAGGPENVGIRRVWNMAIVETLAVAARNPIVGDGRRAIVFDRMDGAIYIADQHSDWFTKNLFAILAESRLALAVLMPKAFAKVSLDDAIAA